METSRDKNHPVWEVYDLYRTAKLNIKYLGARIESLRRINLAIEFILAISVSSGVAGLWLWETVLGGYVWKTLGVLTALLAVFKPLANFTNRIQSKMEIFEGYRVLEFDLKKIVVSIKNRHSYDTDLQERFFGILHRLGEIARKDREINPNKKLLKRCQQEVLKELPSSHFFVPSVS